MCVCAHARKPRVCGCPVHDSLVLELQVATALGLKTRLLLKGQKILLTTNAPFRRPALLHSVSPCVECISRLPWNFPFLTHLPKCCIYKHTQPHHHYSAKLRAELAGLVLSQTSVLSPPGAFQFPSRSQRSSRGPLQARIPALPCRRCRSRPHVLALNLGQ